MKDVNGNTIEAGQTLVRVKEERGASIGHKYIVIQYNFDNETEGDDLVADGGYIKELLTRERAKEFEIVKSDE